MRFTIRDFGSISQPTCGCELWREVEAQLKIRILGSSFDESSCGFVVFTIVELFRIQRQVVRFLSRGCDCRVTSVADFVSLGSGGLRTGRQ